MQELLGDAEQFVMDLEAKGEPAKGSEHDVRVCASPMKDVDKGSATKFVGGRQTNQVSNLESENNYPGT